MFRSYQRSADLVHSLLTDNKFPSCSVAASLLNLIHHAGFSIKVHGNITRIAVPAIVASILLPVVRMSRFCDSIFGLFAKLISVQWIDMDSIPISIVLCAKKAELRYYCQLGSIKSPKSICTPTLTSRTSMMP
jgi:hypothetical protein